MSTVLLSNWFPIRMYDSTDPRLSAILASIHLLRGLALLGACSFFYLLHSLPLSLPIFSSSSSSFFLLTRLYDSVHRVGRLSG